MQIDAVERSVKISVGELACFQNNSGESFRGGQEWRAELGRKWHTALQEKTAEEFPLSEFELTLKKTIRKSDWTFHIQGRIDQFVSDGKSLNTIREIKTVRHPLPEKTAVLKDKYPHYFAQLAIYKHLAERLPQYSKTDLCFELTFIDINTGLSQTVNLISDELIYEDYFSNQIKALLPFLNDRINARVRLNEINLGSPFESLRDGQSELLQTLERATLKSSHILLQAPTGFGKTGIVLHHALSHMKQGFFERMIYLTSKSTGQLQTLKQLNNIGVLRHVQMRNRSELSIQSKSHHCYEDTRCDAEFGLKIRDIGLGVEELFEENTFSLEQVKDLGIQHGLCPYALTKWALQYAEIWVGDSNYIFSPNSRNVFFDSYGFDPKKTLVIVDEAHNLPERTADALSIQLSAYQWNRVLESALDTSNTHCLFSIGEEILVFLKKLKGKEILSGTDTYTALDLFEDFSRELKEVHISSVDINPKDLNLIYQIPKAAELLSGGEKDYLAWSPRDQSLKISCLNPAPWIANCLRPFASSIHMSATLGPIDHFRELVGLTKKETTFAVGFAPWRDAAYDIAIDTRVDTRYKSRAQFYELTTDTITTLFAYSNYKPIAIFFPSYQYAQNIETYLKAKNPYLPVIVQPKNLSLSEQKSFIEENLESHSILFFILGSAFTEGIDNLGGMIETAMVVSPALPEINPLSTVKLENTQTTNRTKAFQETYIIPAFQKIHQALGRMVRAPGQKAKVLLHCKRFIQTEYKSLLADEYQSDVTIKNQHELESWLSK